MKAEVDALALNNTWEIVDIPKGKVPMDVYGCTRSSTDQIEMLKDLKLDLLPKDTASRKA